MIENSGARIAQRGERFNQKKRRFNMNDLKVSVDKVSIVQPDFEYLSVIEGDAWIEYGVQKFWLDFYFDGENLNYSIYNDLKDELGLLLDSWDFDDIEAFERAQEEANEIFFDIDSEIFDEIMNQLVERFPATLEELNRKREEEEKENDDEL